VVSRSKLKVVVLSLRFSPIAFLVLFLVYYATSSKLLEKMTSSLVKSYRESEEVSESSKMELWLMPLAVLSVYAL